jgi:hypothetical protein
MAFPARFWDVGWDLSLESEELGRKRVCRKAIKAKFRHVECHLDSRAVNAWPKGTEAFTHVWAEVMVLSECVSPMTGGFLGWIRDWAGD